MTFANYYMYYVNTFYSIETNDKFKYIKMKHTSLKTIITYKNNTNKQHILTTLYQVKCYIKISLKYDNKIKV